MRAINLVRTASARQLARQGIEFRPGHVIGGVGETGRIKDVFVVVKNPDVAAEWKRIDRPFVGQFFSGTAVDTQVETARLRCSRSAE